MTNISTEERKLESIARGAGAGDVGAERGGVSELELSEEEVYDALLGASLSDDVVGKSAQLALQRLGQSSNQKLVQRAVDMLSQHAKALAEERVNNNVAQRAALFRLLSSVVGNYAPPTAGRCPPCGSYTVAACAAQAATCNTDAQVEAAQAAVDVTDFLIEQVLNDIQWEQNAGDDETAAQKEALREAAELLLVQLASHHTVPVLTRLLSRLDGASMFQQQKAQAAARFRSRAGAQWFADRDAPQDHRLIGILSALEAIARGKPELLSAHLKKVLAAMLPVIGLATSAASKEAWSRAMGAYCEAVQSYNEELRACASSPEVEAQVGDASTRMAMLAGYDVLAVSWTASNDPVVQRASFLTLAAMSTLLPPEDLRVRLPKVVSKLCQMLAGVNTTMSVRVCVGDSALQAQARTFVKSLCRVIETALAKGQLPGCAEEDCTQVVVMLAPEIMKAVLPLASRPPDVFDKSMLATFNDSLECFKMLATVDATLVADHLLSALTLDGKLIAKPKASRDFAQRHWGALAVLTHLAGRVEGALADCRSSLISSALLQAASSADPLVRVQLANLIMALAPLGYLDEDKVLSQDCLRFLVASVCCTFPRLKGASSGKTNESRWFGGSKATSAAVAVGASSEEAQMLMHQWWWPREAGIEQMRSVCGNALFLLVSTLPYSHRLLWPFVLTFISDAQYSTALPEVCRTVCGVADRVMYVYIQTYEFVCVYK
jgi:hypothetical protein